MSAEESPVHRYEDTYGILTSLDPVADLLVMAESFTSREFLLDVVTTRHRLTSIQASSPSKNA